MFGSFDLEWVLAVMYVSRLGREKFTSTAHFYL